MIESEIYTERVSSNKTEALFLVLSVLFLALSVWRVNDIGMDIPATVCIGLFVFFLFYSLNYRTLIIRLTSDLLRLRFGLFTWTTATENIERCSLDVTPMWRIGGAGIHFSSIRGRYRIMFNFLEYPRVVVALRKKRGLVRDIVFSTQHPDEALSSIQEAASPMILKEQS